MKILSVLLLVIFLAFSCKKGEVPSNNENYVGVWKNSGPDDEYLLTIHDNGKAEYNEFHVSGASTSSISATGYIYFDGDNFKIGSNLINKKFKTDKSPTRVTISLTPYTYYSLATFNGVDYRKD